ncbi:BTAD domain-containing putative transcriptional regulator [Nocardia sp. NPDC020380]|uniref:AfsR/SARP family transcriptional regulator n=1 Tax=Nocardia sp. NPDC020380 TaxID=3364309 RepID=UPI0037BB8CAE
MTTDRPPALFFRILGPTQVERDGAALGIGGRVSRRMLAALIAGGGQPVSDDTMAEHIWERPPARVVETLRVIAWRLREALGPDGRILLPRSESGYALLLPPGMTDADLFGERVTRGISQLHAGDAAGAVTTFEAALALWRGEPWADLAGTVELMGPRQALAELFEAASEELLAARLADGDTATVIAASRTAVAAGPYRERRWELLALALYRGGRQAEALAELRRARQLLVREIGVEPGPALRSLERRILAHDPGLLEPSVRELLYA